MKIAEIIQHLESIAPTVLQEPYDNAGLITGNKNWDCGGAIICLDATEQVVQEAMAKNINLIISHHPIVFGGIKRLNGSNYVEQAVITAVKNDIAIYAIHTNLDNTLQGVNGKIGSMLGLQRCRVLLPKAGTFKKIFVFVPDAHANSLRTAIFAAGAGNINNYSECSFNTAGTGSFKANPGANPFVGAIGKQHIEAETRIEAVYPAWLENQLLNAIRKAHPYEEPAFDIISLQNEQPGIGSGIMGELPEPMEAKAFLERIKSVFKLPVIRHTCLNTNYIQKVACCGGAGSFLIKNALAAGADCFLTADLKYHEFFDANARLLLADIGHYESEQFTIALLADILQEKFPTFAALKTAVNTNPVHYC